jgi:methyl-accepting chemotaxis protein
MLKHNAEKEVYVTTNKTLHELLDSRITSKKLVGISNAISIANDGKIKEALKTNKRELAISTLSLIHDRMKANTPFKNIKVHVHTKNNHSFVRAWKPKKFGDDLSGFRDSVVKVNATKQPVNTLEIGRAGLSLRSVVPVMDDDNTHLGSLEFMQGLNSVAKAFKREGDAFLILMDTKKSKAKLFDQSKMFKDRYLISQKFIDQKFLAEAQKIDLQKLFKDKFYIGKNYFFIYKDVKNFQNKTLGIYIVGRPLAIVEQSIDSATTIINVAIMLLVALSIILLIITLFNLQVVVIKPLKTFAEAVEALMLFSSASQDIEVKSHDELGNLAKSFNKYMAQLRDTAAKDQQVVEEVDKAIQMVRSGFFVYKVNANSSNRIVNDLKNSVNAMVKDLGDKFEEINKALTSYGNAKFDYDFNVENTSGTIGSIVFGTKAVGNNISELLATIMLSGERLSSTIEVLSNSANSLSRSANEQAASLEETAAAVEEISSNIQNSSENVIKMSHISSEVTNSAKKGEELASQTATSMEEINTQVNAISEAIAVIDQIAFQTNILSLNAAVEAATAGEAGKGFAVVAGEVRNLAARSAEAANEIKALVENATSKANAGKSIAAQMIDGYHELNIKINNNKEIIDMVSMASQEQSKGIAQINDAINVLDKNTQENASDATNIAGLSQEVNDLATRLISVAHHASYKESAREQVCDVDMVYKLNRLKLDHLKFKTDNFMKLNDRTTFKVTTEHDCALAKWISAQERDGAQYTKTQNWKELGRAHILVHEKVQEYINKNATHTSNERLLAIGNEIEKGVEVVTNKVAETFDNLAAHLPFSNLAKKEDSSFHLEVDLPGVKKDNIKVDISGNTLTISGERKTKNEVNEKDYYKFESSFGKFQRSFSLPEDIDRENISAAMEDGVLEVTLPKLKKEESKKIEIK